jgi:hypothetical protein
MFRLPEVKGIINRMGFNNHGIDALIGNVQQAKFRGILGINIGKNADTPIERAADDYLICLDKAYPLASYITVNISSPNTKNLRQLQGESELDALLGQLKARQAQLADKHGRYVPITLKIAPDLDDAQITNIADALRRHRIDAVIATNTTLARDKVQGLPTATSRAACPARRCSKPPPRWSRPSPRPCRTSCPSSPPAASSTAARPAPSSRPAPSWSSSTAASSTGARRWCAKPSRNPDHPDGLCPKDPAAGGLEPQAAGAG